MEEVSLRKLVTFVTFTNTPLTMAQLLYLPKVNLFGLRPE